MCVWELNDSTATVRPRETRKSNIYRNVPRDVILQNLYPNSHDRYIQCIIVIIVIIVIIIVMISKNLVYENTHLTLHYWWLLIVTHCQHSSDNSSVVGGGTLMIHKCQQWDSNVPWQLAMSFDSSSTSGAPATSLWSTTEGE